MKPNLSSTRQGTAEEKEELRTNAFVIPPQEEIDRFERLRDRNLCQDYKTLGKPNICQGKLRRSLRPAIQKFSGRVNIQDDARGKRTTRHLPLTGRDYLWSVHETAKEKFVSKLMREEAIRIEGEIMNDELAAHEYEHQLKAHEEALEMFLFNHYAEVSEILNKRDETAHTHKDLDERLDYFSGLLKAAQTIQEEENERLQELTAFQHFLAAVTPQQSLTDLLRRLNQSKELPQKLSATNEKGIRGEIQKSFSAEDRESLKALPPKSSRLRSAPTEPMTSVGYLRREVLAMRMIDEAPDDRREAAARKSSIQDPDDATSNPDEAALNPDDAAENIGDYTGIDAFDAEEERTGEYHGFDPHLFDPHLNDAEYLLKLSHMYENQCHSLLALLTRLKEKQDSLDKEVALREQKLSVWLSEMRHLQEPSENVVGANHLQDMKNLITGWDQLAGDDDAKKQLKILEKQISDVVSDVFGSSKLLSILKKRGKEAEDHIDMESSVIGSGALLSLLESRVTDLCSQLLLIPKETRDPIFKKCEKERKMRTKAMVKQKEEEQRALRRKQHLERALDSPRARPL